MKFLPHTVIALVAAFLMGCGKNQARKEGRKEANNPVLEKAIAADFERTSGDTVTNVVIEKTFGHYPDTLRSAQDTGIITEVRARIRVKRRDKPYWNAYGVFVANSDGYAVAKEILDKEFATKCAENLRMIDLAVRQWALEKEKPPTAWPKEEDLIPYLKNHRFPECPSGGFYPLYPVKAEPMCMSGGMGHNRASY